MDDELCIFQPVYLFGPLVCVHLGGGGKGDKKRNVNPFTSFAHEWTVSQSVILCCENLVSVSWDKACRKLNCLKHLISSYERSQHCSSGQLPHRSFKITHVGIGVILILTGVCCEGHQISKENSWWKSCYLPSQVSFWKMSMWDISLCILTRVQSSLSKVKNLLKRG